MNDFTTKAIIKLVLIALFLGCLADWPYGYYQLVRFAGMVGFIMLAGLDKGSQPLLIFWVSSAILINPFFKVSLGREVWNLVDIFWAVVLLATLVFEYRNSKADTKVRK